MIISIIFKKLFNFIKYQVDYRSAIFELNLKIQHEKSLRFAIESKSTAIPTAELLIDLLKNRFTSSEQVYDHIILTVKETLDDFGIVATIVDPQTGQIRWQEIFEAIDGIKFRNTREKIVSKLRQYETVSEVFGWNKKYVI
jgi:hypothetical protein